MVSKIQKWGNSQGLRLTREVFKGARMEIGEEVEVSTKDGIIEIRPVRRARGKYNIDACIY